MCCRPGPGKHQVACRAPVDAERLPGQKVIMQFMMLYNILIIT